MPRAVIIEPFTHPAPTGRGWAEGLSALDWEIRYFQTSGAVGPMDIGIPAGEDLLVICDVPRSFLCSSHILVFMKKKGSKIIAVVSDEPNFDIPAAAPFVDLFVSHTLRHDALDAKFAAAGAKLHHIPFGGSERVFGACVPRETPEYDVAFIGSFWHGDRGGETYITSLGGLGLRTFYAGFGGKPGILYQDTARIYENSKVCLNFHYPRQKQQTQLELNGRTFDLAVAGAFQVCDEPASEALGLAYSLKPKDWAYGIQNMLRDDLSRKRLARQARERALDAHTWKHRMAQVLALLSS